MPLKRYAACAFASSGFAMVTWTRFLGAKRGPPRYPSAGRLSLENALVEPAAGKQFARPVRTDRRVGRNRPRPSRIAIVGFIGDRVGVINDTAGRTRAAGSRHLGGRVDRSVIGRGVAQRVGPPFRHRNLAADRTAVRRPFRDKRAG